MEMITLAEKIAFVCLLSTWAELLTETQEIKKVIRQECADYLP